MKKLLLLVLIVQLAYCGSLSEQIASIQQNLNRDKCFEQRIETIVARMREGAVRLEEESVESYVDDYFAAFSECSNIEIDTKWIKILGEFFTLGSPCLRDIGSILLFVNSILEDPLNPTFDFYFAVLIYYAARKGIKQSGEWIQFIDSVIHPNTTLY